MKAPCLIWTIALIATTACACAQLPGQPGWRDGAGTFSGRDGVIYADDSPFLLIYDFTWVTERDARFYDFVGSWGGTTTYAPVDAYEAASQGRVFYSWEGRVAQSAEYLREHPEAALVGQNGEPVGRDQVCFLNPGYRDYLRPRLVDLARSPADRPHHFGYYPQDEFAYARPGCYCESCIERFRQRMKDQYGTIEALNEAWDTALDDFDEIEPPRRFAQTRAFCDWQEFRRRAQLDFARFVYETLKEHDPRHMVIWSIPYWGPWGTAAAWWEFPKVSDVLMRCTSACR